MVGTGKYLSYLREMASLTVGPDVDPQMVEWASRLRLAVMPLSRQLRQQATEAFTPTQLSVIGTIHRHGPVSLGDLAARERLSPPTISKVVAAIEAEGLIERIADPEDRRVCRVRVTRGGERWIERGRAARNEWLAERIAALAAAVPVLERLVDDE